MTAKILRRWMFAVTLGVACCGVAYAQAIDTRCIADGGIALCTEPTNVADPASAPVDTDMWTYNVCDFDGAFAWRGAAWTKVLGGKPHLRPRHRSRVDGFRADRQQRLPDRRDRQRLGLHDSAQHPLLDRRAAREESKSDPRFPEAEFHRVDAGFHWLQCAMDGRRIRGKMARGRVPQDVQHAHEGERRSRVLEIAAGMRGARQRRQSRSHLLDGCKAQRELGLPVAHARRPRGRALLQQRRLFPVRRRRPRRRPMSGARRGTGASSCRRWRATSSPMRSGPMARCWCSCRPGGRCTTAKAGRRRCSSG